MAHIHHWWDEVVEFFEAICILCRDPSASNFDSAVDEFSDVCVGFGRIHTWFVINTLRAIGVDTDVVYIRFPGDWLYINKIRMRHAERNCIRSPRHLVNGMCPNA